MSSQPQQEEGYVGGFNQTFVNYLIKWMSETIIQQSPLMEILQHWTLIVPILMVLAVLVIYRQKRNRVRAPVDVVVKLVDKNRVSHDTFIYTFLLPEPLTGLGLKIGEHILTIANINGEVVERKYTPTKNNKNTFDLLIKVYEKCEKFPEGGKMSLYINSLEINDTLQIRYPYGRFNYQGNGKIQIRSIGANPTYRHPVVQRLYMIAGGTGITPIYQIIQYICANPEDKTELTLLFMNRTEEDILLNRELDAMAERNPRLKVFYSVDRSITQHWTGFTGFLDKKKIEETLPANKGLMCLSCGPPILSNIAEKIWGELGVKSEDMFRF